MQYSKLIKLYEKLNSTTKRLDKTYFIAEFLKDCKKEELDIVMPLLQAKVFPPWDERKIGVSDKYVIKAISIATGFSANVIEKEWKNTGDLGEAANNLIENKNQSTLFSKKLSVKKIVDNIRKLAEMTGAGSVDQKVKLIAELYTSAKSAEAKYITRLILEDLRVGVGESSIRDAIAWAYLPPVYGVMFYCKECKKFVPKTKKCILCKNALDTKLEMKFDNFKVLRVKNFKEIDNSELHKYDIILTDNEKSARNIYDHIINKIQNAIDISNDLSLTAKKIKEKGLKGLKDIEMQPLNPIKVMLYPKAKDIKDAFERLGRPMALEYKYDGFRLNIHRLKNKIKLFTRRLEDVTTQFPDVIKFVKEHIDCENYILDSEIVGYDKKTGKYLPFQSISQRIKRKYDIDKMAKDYPVVVTVFDIMEYNGKSMLNSPFIERRKILENITTEANKKILLAKQLITEKEEEANAFYQESLQAGEEGVMAKSLDAPYKPGARIGYGLKIKPVMESLDLVIVNAEWGTGKRGKWLSSFTLACRDDGEFLEIGKVGTGFKEKSGEGLSFEQLTKLLKPLILDEKGRQVEIQPQIVIEVNFEEIQKSPTYSSGYALRFPRVIRLREDRAPDECSDIELVEELYYSQRGRG